MNPDFSFEHIRLEQLDVLKREMVQPRVQCVVRKPWYLRLDYHFLSSLSHTPTLPLTGHLEPSQVVWAGRPV